MAKLMQRMHVIELLLNTVNVLHEREGKRMSWTSVLAAAAPPIRDWEETGWQEGTVRQQRRNWLSNSAPEEMLDLRNLLEMNNYMHMYDVR